MRQTFRPRRSLLLLLAAVLLSLAAPAAEETAPPAPTVSPSAAEAAARQEVVAIADQYATELMQEPPDGVTREEIAFAFGWMHFFGMVGEKNTGRAEEYLRSALDAGLAEAGVALAGLYLERPEADGGRDVAQAMDAYEKAAALGSIDARRLLGMLFLDGAEGITPDAEKGRRYLTEAARNGSEAAAGRLKAEGVDVPADPELTAAARQRAAKLSAAVAAVFDLLEQRLAQAEEAVQSRAAAANSMSAEERERLTGVLKKAVDEGAREIMARQPSPRERGETAAIIGAFHSMGMLHGVDMPKAMEYLRLAVDDGAPEAMVTLAELFLGLTILEAQTAEPDTTAALDLLQRAAEGGSADALRLLGVAYAEGLGGVEPDPEKARRYLLDAGRQGDPEALERLAPVFAEAARWNAEHPDEKSPLPAGADELVDPVLSRAREERLREMADRVTAINAELGRKATEAIRAALEDR